MKDLLVYKNSMNPNSYEILCTIYQKYTSQVLSTSNISKNIITKNASDFIKLRYFKIVYRYDNIDDILNFSNDLLYIKKNPHINYNNKSPENYGFAKRVFLKSDTNIYNLINDSFKDDFVRFIGISIHYLHGEKKTKAVQFLANSLNKLDMKIDLLFAFIDSFQYINAENLLDELEPSKEIENIFKNADKMKKIKIILKKIPIEKANKIIKKFNLDIIFSDEEIFEIYFNKTFPLITFSITRSMLLNDSICYFLDNNMKNKTIEIKYVDELASDEGGLSRDWFTNVSKELINTEIFIPVPNGNTLTFNHDKEDMMLYNFVGQFIATAFNNKKTVNIKLASFIWKRMLNEEITLEDMKDYDTDYYESLKWISENDPSLLEMTFVDSNDVELCQYGGDILVTNENKEEYIKLIIENKLINENIEALDCLANGFKDVIDSDFISLFSSKKIRSIVNGIEIIDVNDWKQNTVYNNECKKEFNDFFRIISKWPNEKLQKLLVFATGSSNIPFGGFKNLVNYGGPFTLHFNKNDPITLPTSHTCFNKIEIPCYPSYEIFEQKLTLAIECDAFGFS